MNLDDLFAAAKRNGIGVLVINELSIHNGDVINAHNVAGGDIDTSITNTLTVPREALHLAGRNSAPAIGESGACVPYAGPDPWAWRYADVAPRAAQHQRDYAAECDRIWQVIDNG